MNSNTALIVIDIQRGLLSLSKISRRKFSPTPLNEVAERIDLFAKEVSQKEGRIILVRVVVPFMPRFMKERFGKLLFSEELLSQDNVNILTKTSPNAFQTTNLLQILQEKNIEHLIITGAVTENGVLHTVEDALKQGFQVSVIKNCCTSISTEKHNQALQVMRDLGVKIL